MTNTKKKKVKDLREGDIVVISHNNQRMVIRDAQPCRARGYYRAETADPNYPINTHGDNTVDVAVFD